MRRGRGAGRKKGTAPPHPPFRCPVRLPACLASASLLLCRVATHGRWRGWHAPPPSSPPHRKSPRSRRFFTGKEKPSHVLRQRTSLPLPPAFPFRASAPLPPSSLPLSHTPSQSYTNPNFLTGARADGDGFGLGRVRVFGLACVGGDAAC